MSTESMKALARQMAVQLSADARTAQRLLDLIDLWPVREAALLEQIREREERIRELEERCAQLEEAALAGLRAFVGSRRAWRWK